jgi:hypothetical protein
MSSFDPFKPPSANLESPREGASGAPTEVPRSVVALLAETRPWVRLIVVLFAIGLGLGGIAVVVAVVLGPSVGIGRAKALAFVPMLLVLLLYVPPVVYLSRYVRATGRLQAGDGMGALEDALRSQKSFWKYVGLFAAIMIGIYLLAGAGGLLAALAGRPR